MKPKKHLSFSSLREELSACFNKITEKRQAGKVEHTTHDALMSGFACMYFQDPSLLQFQKRLEKTRHTNNLKTLFGVNTIPEATQLRGIIDEVDSSQLAPFFDTYFYRLQRGKHLERYQLLPGLYLSPMDATQYFSSGAISCEGCLRTKPSAKKGVNIKEELCEEEGPGVTYTHKVLQLAIMHPAMKQVIPLMPEEIRNVDGATKQDCEINAAKRLLPKLRKAHPQLGLVIGGDDLYSRQPMILEVRAARMNYIFVAKPDSHKYMMEWIEAYQKLHGRQFIDAQGARHEYEWMNDVPLHGGGDAIKVNYYCYRLIKTDKEGKEKVTYRNSWVTDIVVTEKNVQILVKGGRCRWKIENECFNTLKNQGYSIEHNYGHGKNNLCFNFYVLTLIAFAFHQVFELTDRLYQTCRQSFGSKKNLWETLRNYINLLIFDSWESFLAFTLNPEHYLPDKPPAFSALA